MEPHLRLRADQQRLTPEQEAEADRFTEAYLRRLLSTEPVDEAAATALLGQAYAVAGVTAPHHTLWVDGPCQLIAVWVPEGFWDGVHTEPVKRANFWETIDASALESVWKQVSLGIKQRVQASLRGSLQTSRKGRTWQRGNVYASVTSRVWRSAGNSTRSNVSALVWNQLEDRIVANTWGNEDRLWSHRVRERGEASISVYRDGADFACSAYFDASLAPNDLHALAQFHALVSGYWLGEAAAIIVRRPHILSLDEAGCLHSATGPCIEYHDGWGFYAWHGVAVPERVILAPEALTRQDFLGERDIEVRRVIQERMGSRFVWELEGTFIDGGPQGVLYEVALPGDPERVARYVQVQDASTPHQYFLRVPPTIQTVAEALAWSFGMSVEDYHPVQET